MLRFVSITPYVEVYDHVLARNFKNILSFSGYLTERIAETMQEGFLSSPDLNRLNY